MPLEQIASRTEEPKGGSGECWGVLGGFGWFGGVLGVLGVLGSSGEFWAGLGGSKGVCGILGNSGGIEGLIKMATPEGLSQCH